jgi:hypothetical protein
MLSGQNTVGLIQNDPGASPGYTLFQSLTDTVAYLIDPEGQMVHKWISRLTPGATVELLESGALLRTGRINGYRMSNSGGSGGSIQYVNWDGTLTWDYRYASDTYLQHHDVERLPNGHVLFISWGYKTAAQAYAAGRDTGNLLSTPGLWPDKIVEVIPQGATGGRPSGID